MSAIACAVLVSVAAVKGLYGRRYVRHNAPKILSAWTIAFVATLVLMLVVDPVGIGARYVVAWLAAGAFSLAGRYAFDRLVSLRSTEPTETLPPPCCSGLAQSCSAALATLASLAPADRVRVVGLVVPDGELASDKGPESAALPSWRAHEHLARRSSATGVTQVILADPASLNGQLQSVMDACRDGGVALKVVSLGLHQHPDAVTYIPGLDCPLFVVRPQPAGAGSYLVKQVADRVGSALLLVVLSPLILLIAALIKRRRPGPSSSWRSASASASSRFASTSSAR